MRGALRVQLALGLAGVAGCGGSSLPSPEEALSALNLPATVRLPLAVFQSEVRPECTPCVATTEDSYEGVEGVPLGLALQADLGARLVKEYLVPRGLLKNHLVVGFGRTTLYLPGSNHASAEESAAGGDVPVLEFGERTVVANLARRVNLEITGVEALPEGWETAGSGARPTAFAMYPNFPQMGLLALMQEMLHDSLIALSLREVKVSFRYAIESVLPGMPGRVEGITGSAILFLREGDKKWERLIVMDDFPVPPHEVEELRAVTGWLGPRSP